MIFKKNSSNIFILKQVVISSLLVSLSILFENFLKKPFNFMPLKIRKFFFLDIFSFFPLLFLPLLQNKYLSFISAFLSEFLCFWLRKSSKNFPYKPILSFSYAFCWGFLPNLFLTKNNNSFWKTYLSLILIFIFYFLTYHLLSLNLVLLFVSKNKKNLLNCLDKYFWILPIRFFSFFLISFLISYLYLKIKKQIIHLL
ncbi:hypothetical protein [Candidatus Phytoplasma pini]|uniref:Uncharacterized protein n=1 Tax=Candidatus Phytoplasma pini TaxID=267362 RepID=A0A559KJT8_9MOLU|nr:hypothetical protein [Candidatus Phytoplasma pini]TVY12391.1 hypothetical protein MDPP_004 [Candidatus Phytoplasma pini]